MAFDHKIVLVHPRTPDNVGLCARAMKSMGFGQLVLVGQLPQPLERVRWTAVHSWDVVENAVFVDGLEEALVPDLVPVAFAGKDYGPRSKRVLDLEEWADLATELGRPMALVFGSERYGLSKTELARCDWVVQIPTHPDQPSLNLSHAVQLATYALYRRQSRPATERTLDAATVREWSQRVVAWTRELGLFPRHGAEEAERLVRSLLFRARIGDWEARWLIKQARCVQALVNALKSPRGSSSPDDRTRTPER